MKVRCRPITLSLLFAALLGVLARAPAGPARAQSPDCDPSEQITCLEIPDDTGGGTMDPGGPSTATAPVLEPAPCPLPVDAAVATPLRACRRSEVAAAINRANAAYVRALRTIDPTVLRGPWSGEALRQFEEIVAGLRAAGRYATPALLAISAEDVRYVVQDSTRPVLGAQVRTLEHWIYQERARGSGNLLVSLDEWVRNDYTLELRAGGWTVVRDVLTLTDPPSPPRPAVSASVSTDRVEYEAGASIGVTIVNDGATGISHGLTGYACGPVTVERLAENGTWSAVPNPPTFAACTLIARLLNPGESESASVGALRNGVYRVVFRYSAEGVNRPFVAYSAPFVVR